MQDHAVQHGLRVHHAHPPLPLSACPRAGVVPRLLPPAGVGRTDGCVMMWDVRMATGPLRALDMHNGSGASTCPLRALMYDGNGASSTTAGGCGDLDGGGGDHAPDVQ